jgi:hypothetical protein
MVCVRPRELQDVKRATLQLCNFSDSVEDWLDLVLECIITPPLSSYLPSCQVGFL